MVNGKFRRQDGFVGGGVGVGNEFFIIKMLKTSL